MNYFQDDIIENYIEGRLSSSEKQLFEQALQTNVQLQKEVIRKKETIQVAKEMAEVLLSDRIKKIVQEEMAVVDMTPKVARRRWLYVISAAAAAVLLLVVTYFSFFQTTSKHKELFAQHFEPYEISIPRSSTQTVSFNFEEGIKAYHNENYPLALSHFKPILKTDIIASLAAGICYLEIGAYQEAILQFQSLNQTIYKNQGLWYEGLTYLKMNDINNSKRVLQQLIKDHKEKPDTMYIKKAKILLQSLEK